VLKRYYNMDSEDIVRKFHQKGVRSGIRDPGSGKIHPGSGSRIQEVKKHRIPDPDPQHWCEVSRKKLQKRFRFM
jgi:hypothetical protein